MTLTQISTAGVKDDAVTSGKIPANAVGSSELADNAVDTAAIANGAVTEAKLGTNSVTVDKIADNAVGAGELASNAVTTAKIADQAVDLTKLPHGTSSNDGKFLRANNGADPTFETVNTDLVADTSPQLGGDLSSNGNNITLADNDQLRLGNATGGDIVIKHTTSDNDGHIENHTGDLFISTKGAADDVIIQAVDDILLQPQGGEAGIKVIGNGAVELYNNDSVKFKTLTDGCQTVGKLGVNTSSPAKNLHVADSGVATVRIETTDSRGQAWDILSTNGAQNNTGTLSFRDESGSAYLEFGANEGSPKLQMNLGGANALLLVDNVGNVTKPKTPAFLAHHQSSDLNYAVGDTLAYMNETFDIGNDYDTSTYTFTAPVDGRYLFSANANANYDSGASGIPRAYWKINGSNVGNHIHLRGSDNANTGSDADGLEQRSQTVIFNLSANDTVKIVVGQNRWDLFGANSFCGYLLG